MQQQQCNVQQTTNTQSASILNALFGQKAPHTPGIGQTMRFLPQNLNRESQRSPAPMLRSQQLALLNCRSAVNAPKSPRIEFGFFTHCGSVRTAKVEKPRHCSEK